MGKTKNQQTNDQPQLGPTEPTPEQVAEAQAALEAERVAAIRARLAELMAEVASLNDQLSSMQNHVLDTSAIEAPCSVVRKVFLAHAKLLNDNLTAPKRGEVVRACVAKGIALNTAKTQYQHNRSKWLRGELTIEA